MLFVLIKKISELSAMLKLPLENRYHTGIRRDKKNKNIWKRSIDGVLANIQDWHSSRYPRSNDDYDFLYWYLHDNSDKNTIFNWSDLSYFFICEY